MTMIYDQEDIEELLERVLRGPNEELKSLPYKPMTPEMQKKALLARPDFAEARAKKRTKSRSKSKAARKARRRGRK